MNNLKKRTISLLMILVMVFTYVAGDFSLTTYADQSGEAYYTQKGEETKISLAAFAQNTTSDWAWMSMGDTANLLYQDKTALDAAVKKDTCSNVNSSAKFGLFILDGTLAEDDSSKLKFHVGTVTIKADGYKDLVIDLNKDYDETYQAVKVTWGLSGNSTEVILNEYLPKDANERANYLKKITNVSADVTLTDYLYSKATPTGQEFPPDYKYPTEMRDISATDLVKDMKVGWNLAGSLESTGGETGWGNPKTKITMIDEIKKAGFNTVRIPVRWDEHYTDSNYTIDPAYMDRVETIVNYALYNGMYAIINIHHNKSETQVNEQSKDAVLKEFEATWTQVGNRFKDYGDKLIFETQNEPINGNDWTGYSSLYEIVNQYNAKALSAIRATGGNNLNRLVMMPTYAASSNYDAIAAMKIPADDHIAMSIHAYLPYDFALNSAAGSQSTFGDTDKANLNNVFALLNNTFVKKGIPVVIGEFAANNKNNLEARIAYAQYYVQTAAGYGIPCCWWDDGVFDPAQGESMGLFNRKTLEFVYPEIVKALMDGWKNAKVDPTDENVLFSGSATSSNWGQAVKLNSGVNFQDADFTDKLAIAVDYTCENVPELILAGSLDGVSWVRVSPAICKTNGATKTAYFTLNDMVSAYKKALSNYDSYGKVFPGLQTIYIGDTGSKLTVAKVYKIYVKRIEETVKNATINTTDKVLDFDSKTENTTTLSVTLPKELQKIVDTGLSTSIISCKSSNEKVATVSNDGKITATGIGTAIITTTITVGESTKSFTTTIQVKGALKGDVNGDKKINVIDYLLLVKYIGKKSVNIKVSAADLNNDGVVDNTDKTLLIKAIFNYMHAKK